MAQGKLASIIAWSLAGILLIGLIGAVVMGVQQSGRASTLGDALLQVGATAGVEGMDPAGVKDTQAIPAMQKTIEEAIQAIRMDLATTTDNLTASQAEADGAKTQVDGLQRRVQEQTAQSESLSKELAAKGEALETAKADLTKASEDADKAVKEAEKQVARLEKTVDRMKKDQEEKEAEVAQLQAEIEALKAPPAEEMAEGEMMEGEEAMTEEGLPEGTIMIEETAVEEPMVTEPEIDLEEGRVIGQSKMFSNIWYDNDQKLVMRLLDGQILTYEEVPAPVVENLVRSEDRLDITYRFQIQGEYKCTPPDSVVIRKFYKWNRRNKASGEVRYVEPEAVPEEVPAAADEAAAEGAEAPVEEPAAE